MPVINFCKEKGLPCEANSKKIFCEMFYTQRREALSKMHVTEIHSSIEAAYL